MSLGKRKFEADDEDVAGKLRLKSCVEQPECLKAMIKLWRENQLCDVSILVEGQVFPAHRLVLSAGSPYYHAQFLGAGAKLNGSGGEGIFELKDMRSTSFSVVLEYIYTHECQLRAEDLSEVLQASQRLQVDMLSDLVVDALVERITNDNCIDAWDLGDRMTQNKLIERARVTAIFGFSEISKSAKWASLPVHRVVEILSSDMLCAREERVFESVVSWINGNNNVDVKEQRLLFENVRFPLLENDFVVNSVRDHALMPSGLLLNALIAHIFVAPVQRRKSELCIVDVSSESEQWKATCLIDNKLSTWWQTNATQTYDGVTQPHFVTVKMRSGEPISRLSYLKRYDNNWSPETLKILCTKVGNEDEWEEVRKVSINYGAENEWIEIFSPGDGPATQVRVQVVVNINHGYNSKLTAIVPDKPANAPRYMS
jgi:hypothetical protein